MLGETVLIALIKAIGNLVLIIDSAYATVIAVFIVHFTVAFVLFTFYFRMPVFNYIVVIFIYILYIFYINVLHNNNKNNV